MTTGRRLLLALWGAIEGVVLFVLTMLVLSVAMSIGYLIGEVFWRLHR